jgi:hypothetical protein
MPSKKSVTSTALPHRREQNFMMPPRERKRNLAIPLRTDKHAVPPLFVTKALRKTIERMLPSQHHQRLRKYFEIYGCMHCLRKNVLYGANGFCMPCIGTLGKRLRRIDKILKASHFDAPPGPDLQAAYLRPYNSARRILADLVPCTNRKSLRRKPEPKSPPKVYLKL